MRSETMIEIEDSVVLKPGFTLPAPAITGPETNLYGEAMLSYSGEMAMDARWRRVEPAPVVTPPLLLLSSLPHPQMRLRVPLRLRVEREGDLVSVWNEEVEELGYGPHLTAAVEDFQQTVVELYTSLRQDRERLGPALQVLWNRLEHLVEWRP